MLGIGAVVVLHEHHPQLILHIRVGIDKVGYFVNVLYYALGPHIAGSCLGAEYKRRGSKVGQAAVLDRIIDVHYTQGIEQLPLVLVHTLYLHIEHELRRYMHAFLLTDNGGKLRLLLLLYGVEGGYICVRHMLL